MNKAQRVNVYILMSALVFGFGVAAHKYDRLGLCSLAASLVIGLVVGYMEYKCPPSNG